MKDNQIKIYAADIRNYESLSFWIYISKSRREKMDRFVKPADKSRCLVAGLMEKFILGIENDDDIIYGVNGKPLLKKGKPFFNLSHSGNYVVLAVSNNSIGIDIEEISGSNFGSDFGFAKVCFTNEEYAMTKLNGAETFFKIWTAKESIMKASGLGFLLPPESFTVLPLTGTVHEIIQENWYFHWVLYDNHIICTASNEYCDNIEFIRLSKDHFSLL